MKALPYFLHSYADLLRYCLFFTQENMITFWKGSYQDFIFPSNETVYFSEIFRNKDDKPFNFLVYWDLSHVVEFERYSIRKVFQNSKQTKSIIIIICGPLLYNQYFRTPFKYSITYKIYKKPMRILDQKKVWYDGLNIKSNFFKIAWCFILLI